MGLDWDKTKQLVRLQARFALSGALATAVDYVGYLLLVDRVLPPVSANVVSYSCAVGINFLMQRYFVFRLQRSAPLAFGMALLVSLGGLLLSTGIIYGLNHLDFFRDHQFITKLIATGVVFFYNFFGKRYVFEKRWW